MYEFKLPDVGEGLHEAVIGRWLVQLGDTVTRDQPMVEIETDKALVEIPSPIAGTIAEIRIPEGDVATVGTVIILIEPRSHAPSTTRSDDFSRSGRDVPSPRSDDFSRSGRDVASPQSKTTTGKRETTEVVTTGKRSTASSVRQPGLVGAGKRVLAAPVVRKLGLQLGVDLGQVKGSGPAGRILAQDVHQFAAQPAGASAPAGASEALPARPARVLAAPAVRKMAWDLGVDLADVQATGAEGRVLPEDVQRYVAQQKQVALSAAEAAAEAAPDAQEAPVMSEPVARAAPQEMASPSEMIERVPLRGLRRRIAQRMEEAWRIPHVTSFEEIDATDLVALRQQLKAHAAQRDVRLTFLPLIVKITLQALKENPYFNATIDMQQQEILVRRYYHIGIATAIPEGLVVPVLRDADKMSILEIAQELTRLGQLARQRKLQPKELSGSTFTITNFGSFGGYMGTPIINPPEVAILGCGRITKKPVVIDDQIQIRSILPIALSYDHRLLDGAAAGQFLAQLRQLIENPHQLLLELA